MGEAETIAATPEPRTRSSLRVDLEQAGLAPGMTVLVHSSLSALGWVAGGAVSVIEALMDALGPQGTLVMPAQSGQMSDPARWREPPVPESWIDVIRAELPAYDPKTTPTPGMGAIAETFRSFPGTARSLHPNCSFTANGPLAEALLADHRPDSPLGEFSPLARLYDADAHILMLGADFENCTMLHLAESRAWPDRKPMIDGGPMMVDGSRQWVGYECARTAGTEHFEDVGAALIANGKATVSNVGSARAVMVRGQDAVDTAVAMWRDIDAIV